MKGNLRELDTLNATKVFISQSLVLYRQSLANIEPSAIIKMAKSNKMRGLDICGTDENDLNCSECVLGKGRRSSIPKNSRTRASKLLELVHSEVNGPLETPSLGGSRYLVTFIDDFSRWTTLYTMNSNSETSACFKLYYASAERHTGSKISRSTSSSAQIKLRKNYKQCVPTTEDNTSQMASRHMYMITVFNINLL